MVVTKEVLERPLSSNGRASAADSPGETAAERRWARTAGILTWGCPTLGLLVVILYALEAAQLRQFGSIVGTAVAFAGAAACSGGLLGFLFAIPRTLQQGAGQLEEGRSAAQRRVAYGANTNLEQISDWLTKILVGVGLTQIRELPTALGRYASAAAIGLGGFKSSPAFSVALLIYFLVCGFLLGYVWTRLHFVRALSHADMEAEVARVASKVSVLEEQVQKDAQALSLVQRQLEPGKDATPVSEAELTDLLRQASDSVRRQALSMAQEARRENWRERERKPRMERTIPVFRALISIDTDGVYHAYRGQLGYALKDKLQPDWPGAEALLTQAIEMRGPWQSQGWEMYEFNRALCRIKLDPAFSRRSSSDEATKEAIWNDISAAASVPYLLDRFDGEPDIGVWLETNQLSLQEFARSADETSQAQGS